MADFLEGIVGGFAESIGEMFLDVLWIVFLVIVLLILGILALMGRFVLPKPYGLIAGIICIGVAIYIVWNGGL